MSSSIRAPSRSLLRALKSSEAPACHCSRTRRVVPTQRTRSLSSTTSRREAETPPAPKDGSIAPKWAVTPPAMKAPVRVRAKPPGWRPFEVNGDPAKLDAVYSRLLGKNGPSMLSDETKWLAVTHKSFDHGRRGFNDRLSFLGRQIIELQTSVGMLASATANGHTSLPTDPYGRHPFHHPATEGAEILNKGGKQYYLSTKAISNVARQYGLQDVVRWQPKDVDNLPASGLDMVLTQALYAIVGALALEQGGAVANRVARERVLLPAGLKAQSLPGGSTEAEHEQVTA